MTSCFQPENSCFDFQLESRGAPKNREAIVEWGHTLTHILVNGYFKNCKTEYLRPNFIYQSSCFNKSVSCVKFPDDSPLNHSCLIPKIIHYSWHCVFMTPSHSSDPVSWSVPVSWHIGLIVFRRFDSAVTSSIFSVGEGQRQLMEFRALKVPIFGKHYKTFWCAAWCKWKLPRNVSLI